MLVGFVLSSMLASLAIVAGGYQPFRRHHTDKLAGHFSRMKNVRERFLAGMPAGEGIGFLFAFP
jgi:hypothetical protein